jgi:hypothetical protein
MGKPQECARVITEFVHRKLDGTANGERLRQVFDPKSASLGQSEITGCANKLLPE